MNESRKIKICDAYSGIKLLVKPLKLVPTTLRSLCEGKLKLRPTHDPLTYREKS